MAASSAIEWTDVLRTKRLMRNPAAVVAVNYSAIRAVLRRANDKLGFLVGRRSMTHNGASTGSGPSTGATRRP